MPTSRSPLPPVEIVRAHDQRVETFLDAARREALNTLWGFNVIGYTKSFDLAAVDDERVVGALRLCVSDNLGYVEEVIVDPEMRRQGIGRGLLDTALEIASYNNCHKLSVQVPHHSGAQTFFEHCGFHEEAVLPQHAWKKDVAVLRKFLL